MPIIINKAKKPLSIVLPLGKKLHLGPGKSAQVAANAVEAASVKKLAEAGEIEIVAEDSHQATGASSGRRRDTGFHPASSGIRRTGNR
ncbi:MAG TPA: hypothetical protein VMT89_11065 [Candidatus Acidoferrales bacterium]|nr:hypothetical protein [Candidatus Acidoferrales bacterium]